MLQRIFASPQVFIDVIDEGQLAEKIREWGTFEPKTLAAWVNYARPGSTVIDVGCHTGVFAIFAAKLGARPIAIEPMPILIERIKKNAALNGVEFPVIEAAAYWKNGERPIGYRPDINLPYGASVVRADKPLYVNLTVKTIKLDDLKLSNVSAIKIDVERSEIEVLKGAQRIIERWRPAIILEALNDRVRNQSTALLKGTHRLARTIDGRNLLFTPL